MPTPAEIDRIGRSRDPDVLDAAADACEEAGDDARADALRWRAVLGRLSRGGRHVYVSGDRWRARGEIYAGGRPFVWVTVGERSYRLSRSGWTVCRRPLVGDPVRPNRRARCGPPDVAPAVLAALRAALAKVV